MDESSSHRGSFGCRSDLCRTSLFRDGVGRRHRHHGLLQSGGAPTPQPVGAVSGDFNWSKDFQVPFSNKTDDSDSAIVLLENAKFSIRNGLPELPKSLIYSFEPGTQDTFYIAHFRDTSWSKNRRYLENLSVRFCHYIPNNAYVLRIPAAKYKEVANAGYRCFQVWVSPEN